MGNKYVKILCAMLAILLLSLLKYQDLRQYYIEHLPYTALNEYKKTTIKSEKPKELNLDLLIGDKETKLEKGNYTVRELEILSEYENEVKKDASSDLPLEDERVLEDEKTLETLLQDPDKLVDENPTSSGAIKLNAVAAVLMDADTQRVLYGKNEDKELAMASTTKIMTCIVVLESGKLDDVVTVSKYAASQPDVQLNIKAGEQFYLRELLYSLMLESHNDAAVAIAEAVGGSVEGFAELMNQKALELGCTHTHFVTPNGLDATGHYTTATELGKIASYAIQNQDFIGITNTPSYTLTELKSKKEYHVMNKNRFLYLMDGAIGVKTGFTNNAGYCFVGAVRRGERTFISVVLGSGWPPHKQYKWVDTTALMNYGINNYDKKIIMNQKINFPELYIEHGQSSSVPVYAQADLSALIRKDEQLKAMYEVPYTLDAPVHEGDTVGWIKFYIDDELFASVPVYAQNDVSRIDFKYCLRQVLQGFFDRLVE